MLLEMSGEESSAWLAIGDVHGDYHQFVTLLRQAEIIDSRENWSGGATHLVQTGDVLDRGPDSRMVMDLLMKLEKQAPNSGGRVHALIGNHEAMNLYGDLRYVSPGEYEAFQDERSVKARHKSYRKALKEATKREEEESDKPISEEIFRRKWEAEHPLGYFEHRRYLGPRGKYGKWIRSHNTIILINDTLFLHGGISPEYVTYSMGKINRTIRGELGDFSKLRKGMTIDPKGPLWYRGLGEEEENTLRTHVTNLLQRHKVRRIVISHVTTQGAIVPRFKGRVLMIDVGISKSYGGRLACLLIERNKVFAIHRGEKLEIPSDSGEGLLRYLKDAARLDPIPSPLEEIILALQERLTTRVSPTRRR